MTDYERQQLDDLLDVDSGLNDWEIKFLESLDEQRLRKLSEKQRTKLNQIYDRVILEIAEDEDE